MESKQGGDNPSKDKGSSLPSVSLNTKLFNRRNYSEWSYSAELALGGTRRLGYVDRTIPEMPKDNPKYAYWKIENMLIMRWIRISME